MRVEAELNYWRQFEHTVVDGKYHLQRFIGHGASAGVYRADEVVGDRLISQVAVKLIMVSGADEDRQYRELQSIRSFSHPNLVRCLGVGQIELTSQSINRRPARRSFLYVVMDLAEQTLQERLAQGRLTPDETRAVVSQVATGLAYMHDQGIVHRDIKPGNVLRIGNEWKIADFGIVRQVRNNHAVTHTSTLSCTWAYAPPEVLRGDVSPAHDMWSLGVIVVEALTGRRPYEGTDDEIARQLLVARPNISSPLPEPFDSIASGCLIRERSDRWTARRVLGVLADHHLSALHRPTQGRRRVPTLLAVCSIVACLVIFAFVMRGHPLSSRPGLPSQISVTIPPTAQEKKAYDLTNMIATEMDVIGKRNHRPDRQSIERVQDQASEAERYAKSAIANNEFDHDAWTTLVDDYYLTSDYNHLRPTLKRAKQLFPHDTYFDSIQSAMNVREPKGQKSAKEVE